MTSLALRPPRPLEVLLACALAAWATAVAAFGLGLAAAPWGPGADWAVRLGVPALLTALVVFGRTPIRGLGMAAGVAWAVALAVALAPAIARDPRLALVVPGAVVGALITQRFPAASLAIVFALAGTYGSIKAFTGIPGDSVMDKVINALWAGVLGRLLIGRRTLRVRVTPTLLAVGAFLLVTLLAVFTTEPMSNGVRAFRLAPLFLSLVVLVGYGGFARRTLVLCARAIVVVCFLVAAYATLRWAIGPAGKEKALQQTALDLQYNQLAVTGETKVQGSLPNGVLLGLWSASTIPFLSAVAISWRGRFRSIALIALPLSAVALLGSAQRAGLVAAGGGAVAVVVVHLLSRGFPGPRLGVAVAAALALVVGAAVVYPAIVDSPEKQKRYANLLSPGQDGPYQERLAKWQATLDAIEGRPFGYGLGAGNPVTIPPRFQEIGAYEIDNSYLMIAYDQGLAVLALFGAVMLILLVELLRFAVWTRGPGPAALATAAAGTLVALLAEFAANDFIYAPPMAGAWLIVGLGVAQLSAQPSRAA